MSELLASPFFGIALSIVAFSIGVWIQKKTGLVICNPLIIAIVLVSGVLLLFQIPYESYNEGGSIINMFLAPATSCLAVSVYTRLELLKKNWLPILAGCVAGSLTSMGSVFLRAGRGHDVFSSSQIGNHSHRGGNRGKSWRYFFHYGGGGHPDRNHGKHPGALPDPYLPGEGLHDGGARDRCMQPCGGHLQSH